MGNQGVGNIKRENCLLKVSKTKPIDTIMAIFLRAEGWALQQYTKVNNVSINVSHCH
jgi:hypothetical protein